MLNLFHSHTIRFGGLSCFAWLMGTLLLAMPLACRQNTQSASGQPMRLAVGEIKEVTLSSRSPMAGASENQEVVDVSQKPLTPADSSALGQGNAVPMTFLIKGVTIGSARVMLSDKASDGAVSGRVRKAYRVQVVSN